MDRLIQELIEKTYRELANKTPPKQSSRNWQDPEGYRYLFPWSNAVLLRFFVRLFSNELPKSEYRRKNQIDDAARSVVRNIEEGFKRTTTSEYLQFIGYSQGSLEEVKGDIRDATQDGYLKSTPESNLGKIGINLKDLNIALRKPSQLKEVRGSLKEFKADYPYHPLPSSKNPLSEQFAYRPLTLLYLPLKNLRAEDLTYEIFLELINKTDYLLRQLVISLEKKLNFDKKGYQIDRLRLRYRARGN